MSAFSSRYKIKPLSKTPGKAKNGNASPRYQQESCHKRSYILLKGNEEYAGYQNKKEESLSQAYEDTTHFTNKERGSFAYDS
jgi:hypothetical protein